MKVAVTRKEIESALHDRFGDVFERHEQILTETLPTDVVAIDNALGGFPRGAITEIYGAPSSGRTSLLLSALAAATAREETCALIDCNDTFDLLSAAKAGIDFKRLLWVRCQNNLERAFKAADLVSHAGGFGFVVLNLCDVPAKAVRRIVSSWWFRFRRVIENTPTVLLVLTPVAAVRSCASLALKLKKERAVWPSTVLGSESSHRGLSVISEQGRYLSLVRPLNAAMRVNGAPTHSHFLHAMRIRVNRERPLDFHSGVMQFEPTSGLAMFADIR
ncbi:MAG: hypothetical protein ACT4OT_10480 [Acidobacteriota bacterium]